MKLEHSFTVPADLDTVWQAVLDPERVAPCMPGATLSEVDGDAFKGSVKVKLGPISLLYKGSGEFLSKDEATRTVVIKASGKDSRGNGTAAATVSVTLTPEGESTKGAVVTDLSITGKPAQFGRGLISEVGGKILDTFAACLASKLAPAQEQPAGAAPVTEQGKGISSVEESGKGVSSKAESGKEVSSADSGKGVSSAGESGKGVSSAGEPAKAGEGPALSVVKEPTGGPTAADRSEAVAAGRKAGEATATAAATKRKLAAAPEPTAEPETEAIDLLSYAGPSVLKRMAPLAAVVVAVLVFITLRRRRR